MKLRPYQARNKQNIYDAWDNGAKNVLSVDPTGSGKTVTFANIIKDHEGGSCCIAHRQELVSQISLALARNDISHRIIGPQSVVRLVVGIHMDESGVSYYNPSAPSAVAGVDTLIRRGAELGNWCNSVTKWVLDEGHHALRENKWGKAVAMFPNANGLLTTATPERADGKGLGRCADGITDVMIEGPQMRPLINMGYLTDYRVFAPKTENLDLTNVPIGKDGDYTKEKLKTAVRKSQIIGDVVKHYLRIAPGKLGITFATDVQTATDIAAQFNLAGVPAAVVSAGTPNAERVAILRKFKNRELLQLVNVDLFGEGFDLPALEVVSMARPTKSYALFCQQFGRALRLMISPILAAIWDSFTDAQRLAHIATSEKPRAIIIDHVSNIEESQGGHGLPDKPRVWSLDRRDRRIKLEHDGDEKIPVRSCPDCTALYERIYNKCPYCGYQPEPGGRSSPEQVDGDLIELSASALAAMRGEIDYIDMSAQDARLEMEAKYMPTIGIMAGIKRHIKRQEMQTALRASIAWWGGWQRAHGRSDSESYKRFYFMFGIDVMSAQALKTKDALALAEKINNHLGTLAG